MKPMIHLKKQSFPIEEITSFAVEGEVAPEDQKATITKWVKTGKFCVAVGTDGNSDTVGSTCLPGLFESEEKARAWMMYVADTVASAPYTPFDAVSALEYWEKTQEESE